jgi:hypothetical protein
MRITVNVDNDVLEAAREMAYVRQISTGQALSMFARRGLAISIGTRRDPVGGLLVFDVPDDIPNITPEMVGRAEELEDLRYARYVRGQ